MEIIGLPKRYTKGNQLFNISLLAAAVGKFSILNLFKSGAQGVYYDPSDIERYMVTGPELAVNGAFDTGLSGWRTTTSYAGSTIEWVPAGALKLTVGSSVNYCDTAPLTPIAVEIGKTYIVTLDVTSLVGTWILYLGNNANINGYVNTGAKASTGKQTFTVVSTETVLKITLFGYVANSVVTFDNISVKELTAIDTATLFQNSAGTPPVTAAGQPVGLMLDKSQGLELGPELVPNVATVMGPRNANSTLNSETSTSIQVTSAAAGTYGVSAPTVTPTAGQWYAISMTMTSSVTRALTVTIGGAARNIVCTAGVPFLYTGYNGPATSTTLFDIFAGAAAAGEVLAVTNISVKLLAGNHASQPDAGKRPLLMQTPFGGVRNKLTNTDVLGTQSVTVTAAAHTLGFTGAGTVTLSGAHSAGPLSAGTHVFTPSAGSLTLTVSGAVTFAQLELGSTATPYQKVTNQYTVTEEGKASCWSLKFDGVDDFMSTAAIDFSGTDKVSAWVGATKGTVATQGAVYSFGGLPNLGSMESLNAASAGNVPWAMYADGSFTPVVSPDVSVPDTAVLYQQVDLTGTPKFTGQYNGAPLNAVNNLTSSAMGNYPLHIASRTGTKIFFNGNLYPLVIAGALYDANTVAKMNQYVAKKTGVTI